MILGEKSVFLINKIKFLYFEPQMVWVILSSYTAVVTGMTFVFEELKNHYLNISTL